MISIKAKIIVSVLAVLVFISAGAYLGFKNFYFTKAPTKTIEKPAEEIQLPKQETTKSIPAQALPEFKNYKNTEFGFEIQYPFSWTVTEEINENVRGEMVKEFFFKKPNSDLRFAILPRDGLSYGIGAQGTSTQALIGGSSGVQIQYVLKDGRRLWLLFPQTGLLNWLQDIGRIDAMTSAEDPVGDSRIFEQMLKSFKLAK